jgi:dipeptidyl aminopeptidase/acylaminoacyl peptidase
MATSKPEAPKRAQRLKSVLAILLLTAGCAGSPQVSTPAPTDHPASLTPSPSPGASAEASPVPSVSPVASVEPSPSPTDSSALDAGAWIVYAWDGLFLVRPDGTGRHQLLPDMPGDENHPDWSPDGGHIAFVLGTLDDRSELWIVRADGSGEEMLYSCDRPCNEIAYPDWAPDGRSVYFGQAANAPANGDPTTFMIGRVDLASRQASIVLTREDGMAAEQPRVSPDGTMVAYTRGHYDLGTAIFIADLEGGPETQLTEWDMFAAHADWTADGRIVFNTYDLGFFQDTTEAANLYVMKPDGTGLEQLTSYGPREVRATQPRVAPDGSGIAFTHVQGHGYGTRRLAFLAFDEAEPRWLTPTPIIGTHPQVRPLSGAAAREPQRP